MPVQAIVLDVEGTTTPISFVHDVLFPYASAHLESFIRSHWASAEVRTCLAQAREEGAELPDGDAEATRAALVAKLRADIKADRKTSSLKGIQGVIWRAAYESGLIKGVVYPDVVYALARWRDRGLETYIYSSGTISAQRLLFGNSENGDLLPLIAGHFDLTTGSKLEASSYTAIATQIADGDPSTVLFISDAPLEVKAAKEAGLRVLLARRPGNKQLSAHDQALATTIDSFGEVDDVLH